jgi:hypothetical protein
MVQMTFWTRCKFVLNEVKEGLKIKELYSTAAFRLILGCIVPSFGGYLYYYQIEVTHFSQWQYSELSLVGFAGLIFGSLIFNAFLKESEFRLVLTIACIINSTGAFLTMLFCLGFTFGIPDFLFVLVTSTVTDTLHICYVTLPVLVLLAKLIPEKIEASLFAFLMGLCNLSSGFISVNLGNLFNLWIKCS